MKKWVAGYVGVMLGLLSVSRSHAQMTTADTTRLPAATPYVVIADIQLSGNRLTKAFIIEREVDLQPGDTVRRDALESRLKANADRIFNTRLFVTVDVRAVPMAEPTDSSAAVGWLSHRLLVTVKENWYLWPSPYLRLNDRNFNEWIDRGRDLSRLNYGLYVGHSNLFGRMQRLEAWADVGFATRFTLRYNVPYLDRKRNWGLLTEVNYQALANLAYNTIDNQLDFVYRDEVLAQQADVRLRLRRRQGFYRFHYAELSYSQTQISGTLRDLNPFYLGTSATNQPLLTQQLTSLGYTYRFDNRDNINFSLTGRALIAEVRRVGLLPTDTFRSWRFGLIFADYYQLTKLLNRKWYAGYLLRGQALTNADTPYNLLRGIGYEDDILRGYDLYVVNGSAHGLGRLNLKRQLVQHTFRLNFIKWRQFNTIPFALYLNAFSDWGYVYNKYPERLVNPLGNSLLRSNGLGLEVSTWYNAVVRFNVSRNHLGQTLFFMNLQKDISTRRNL